MLMAGLEAEVAAYVESCEELVDERGYRPGGTQRQSWGADAW